jgi:hypothetical protein
VDELPPSSNPTLGNQRRRSPTGCDLSQTCSASTCPERPTPPWAGSHPSLVSTTSWDLHLVVYPRERTPWSVLVARHRKGEPLCGCSGERNHAGPRARQGSAHRLGACAGGGRPGQRFSGCPRGRLAMANNHRGMDSDRSRLMGQSCTPWWPAEMTLGSPLPLPSCDQSLLSAKRPIGSSWPSAVGDATYLRVAHGRASAPPTGSVHGTSSEHASSNRPRVMQHQAFQHRRLMRELGPDQCRRTSTSAWRIAPRKRSQATATPCWR